MNLELLLQHIKHGSAWYWYIVCEVRVRETERERERERERDRERERERERKTDMMSHSSDESTLSLVQNLHSLLRFLSSNGHHIVVLKSVPMRSQVNDRVYSCTVLLPVGKGNQIYTQNCWE